MPISKKRFEVIGAERVSPETNAEQITAFLLENDELAFRISEIAEQPVSNTVAQVRPSNGLRTMG